MTTFLALPKQEALYVGSCQALERLEGIFGLSSSKTLIKTYLPVSRWPTYCAWA